jgi:hypothetical protein
LVSRSNSILIKKEKERKKYRKFRVSLPACLYFRKEEETKVTEQQINRATATGFRLPRPNAVSKQILGVTPLLPQFLYSDSK